MMDENNEMAVANSNQEKFEANKIATKGPPVYSKARQLNSKKLEIAMQEFKFMSDNDIISPSNLHGIESISEIDYDKIVDAQVDNEELNKLHLKPSLNFKQYPIDDSGKLLWCDISTANIPPFILQPLRMHMFQKIHNLAQPCVKSTVKQIASRFIWLNIRKDVNQWAKSCIQCQKNKINRHTRSQIGTSQEVDDQFSVIHADIIGPFPVSERKINCLTFTSTASHVIPLVSEKSTRTFVRWNVPSGKRYDKYFTVKIKGKDINISVDRLKSAYLLFTDSDNPDHLKQSERVRTLPEKKLIVQRKIEKQPPDLLEKDVQITTTRSGRHFGLAIHQNDHQARRRFVEWAQNEIVVVPDFHKRILFSDEAHFWLNGYVNKQNCRICSEANPQVYVETPLHPEKLTVWCALWAGGIIGPYFFKNDEGHNGTVNGDRYRAMITNFFIPELNNHDVQELWFQQDGATCHTARATIDLLKDTFGDRLISRFGHVNWPPRSCDLTPLDYFLWGYVKSLVYADKPQMLDHLEDNIRRVIADIRPQMLEKVIENWTSRLDYIRASRGNPMPEIIFTMIFSPNQFAKIRPGFFIALLPLSSPFTFPSVFLCFSSRILIRLSKSLPFLIGNKFVSYPVSSDTVPNTADSSRQGLVRPMTYLVPHATSHTDEP
ncbi:transposon Ty3-I Gag-Pol polyprotein [Trichonephila clavipes]|nr:transposon Ty3-I Gag-Pol polyprotein [Trichonephila clavipes]